VFNNLARTARAALTDPYLQGAVAFLLLGRAILGVAEHMKEVGQRSQEIYESVAEQMAQSAANISTVAAANSQSKQPDPDLGPGVYDMPEREDSGIPG
jgi:hypothetical protein